MRTGRWQRCDGGTGCPCCESASVKIETLKSALESIFYTQVDFIPAEDQWASARATAAIALGMTPAEAFNPGKAYTALIAENKT